MLRSRARPVSLLTHAMQRSLVEISETLNDDEDAVVAKLEDLLHVETEAED